jgi:hypothetical protein
MCGSIKKPRGKYLPGFVPIFKSVIDGLFQQWRKPPELTKPLPNLTTTQQTAGDRKTLHWFCTLFCTLLKNKSYQGNYQDLFFSYRVFHDRKFEYHDPPLDYFFSLDSQSAGKPICFS